MMNPYPVSTSLNFLDPLSVMDPLYSNYLLITMASLSPLLSYSQQQQILAKPPKVGSSLKIVPTLKESRCHYPVISNPGQQRVPFPCAFSPQIYPQQQASEKMIQPCRISPTSVRVPGSEKVASSRRMIFTSFSVGLKILYAQSWGGDIKMSSASQEPSLSLVGFPTLMIFCSPLPQLLSKSAYPFLPPANFTAVQNICRYFQV